MSGVSTRWQNPASLTLPMLRYQAHTLKEDVLVNKMLPNAPFTTATPFHFPTDFILLFLLLLEIPQMFPMKKPAKMQEPENNSTPSERRSVWPRTLSPAWPTIDVYRRASEQCRSPPVGVLGGLIGLNGWDRPPLGPPPAPSPAKGPGDVSQLSLGPSVPA